MLINSFSVRRLECSFHRSSIFFVFIILAIQRANLVNYFQIYKRFSTLLSDKNRPYAGTIGNRHPSINDFHTIKYVI